MDRQRLIEAKRNLYHVLLSIPKNEITDTEINIMYELAKDSDIQNILQVAINKEKAKAKLVKIKEG